MTRGRPLRLAWMGAAAILVAAALVALAAVLKGDFSDTDGSILGTLAAVLYAGGALFAGLAVAERGQARLAGWALAAAAPVGFALILAVIWGAFDDGEDAGWRIAFSAIIVLLAGLLLCTALLLARGSVAYRLALAVGGIGGVAAVMSVVAITRDESVGDGYAKMLAAAWILTVLGYALVPVVSRAVRPASAPEERLVAHLGEVELVATTRAVEGAVDPVLRPGERLVLRHRT
jgi:hypothetical protein